jgi:ATP-binding cassette subfamily C (CFTR/MRP) protein 1
MFVVGMNLRTSLISTIYRKALRMNSASKKDSTVGEIVNLMSIDVQRFMDLIPYLNMLWWDFFWKSKSEPLNNLMGI